MANPFDGWATMTPEQRMAVLMAAVPAPLQPVLATYGPALIKMGLDDITAWIVKIAQGDTDAAYKTMLAGLPNADLLNQWNTLNTAWQTANVAEAARRDVIRRAEAALLSALLQIAIIMVGF
jgi:hypothetical protein